MKNSILKLGKVLNKVEQKSINGGAMICDHGIQKCYHGPIPEGAPQDEDGVYHVL